MDGEKIRALRLAHPFKPFALILDDGRRFLVEKPYHLAISAKRDLVLVPTPEGGAVWFGTHRVKEAVVVDSVPDRG